MRNSTIITGLALVALFSVGACDRVEDVNVGGTSTENMSGDWFVTTSLAGKQIQGHTLLTTYNTSANDGKEIWIDDHAHIWDFKVKAPINYNDNTFSGSKLKNEKYNITVNLTEGKVIKGAAKTTGGHKSDSIIFKAEFSDDPGKIYTIGGYKRTGFVEDEH